MGKRSLAVCVGLIFLSSISIAQVFSVNPEGTGDYSSITEAVVSAPPGATIRLAPGIYIQTEPLLITKPLKLVGENMKNTLIIGTTGECVLKAVTSGAFSIEDISFKYEGEGPADVVVLDADEIRVISCSFTGALQTSGRISWAGLMITGNTKGIVRNCSASHNIGEGITVSGDADIVVQSCICSDNAGAGIAFIGSAKGSVEGNICERNGQAGIIIAEQATPEVRDNHCKNNQDSGIWVVHQASPFLRDNVCETNEICGIAYWAGFPTGMASGNICRRNEFGIIVLGQAQPLLQGNACSENEQIGIRFLEEAAGRAIDNRCEGNGEAGIEVAGSAQPFLENNECLHNGETGIAVMGTSTVWIESSVLKENYSYGILISQTPSVTLVACIISGNKGTGVQVLGESTVLVRECEVNENSEDGIFLEDGAAVEIRNSRIERNLLSGLYLNGTSKVLVSASYIADNIHGVEVTDSAQISLTECILHHNRYTGVDLDSSAKAELHSSNISGNLLGLRARGSSRATLKSSTVEENGSGIAVEDVGYVSLNGTTFRKNNYYAVLLLGDACLSLQGTIFEDNGINDVLLGTEPYGLQSDEPLNIEIQAQGVTFTIPDTPPVDVQGIVDAIVEIWPSGFDEITGRYWEFAANGVILSSGVVITVAHVFYGEDTNNPDVWLKLTSLEVVDADLQESILAMEDFKLGLTEHGPHPAAMDHERDVAALYLKDPEKISARGLRVAEATAYGEPVWAVGYVGYLGTGEIWRFIPGVVSIPSRAFINVWTALWMAKEVCRFIPDVWIIPTASKAIVAGMSGSPVVNSEGEVLGVIMFGRDRPEEFGPAIGIALADKLPVFEEEFNRRR